MVNVEEERRTTTRIPARTMELVREENEGPIDVHVEAADLDALQPAVLRDIHASGMSFILENHGLRDRDIVHIETVLDDFAFSCDAIVRWTLGSCVGVEFLDSRSRNAALLAELYTEKLLGLLGEDED